MQIKSAKYIISSPDHEKCPVPDKPEYAFIGRSNVGKSSLINMLCNNEKLAKTSSAPGKTQLINHFEITSSPSLVQKEKTEVKTVAGDEGRIAQYEWKCRKRQLKQNTIELRKYHARAQLT